jgi:hypothetical protein
MGVPLLVALDVDEDWVELVEDTVDEVLVDELWVVEELEETVLDARRSRSQYGPFRKNMRFEQCFLSSLIWRQVYGARNLAENLGWNFGLRECHILEETVDWVELDVCVLDTFDELEELEELGTDTVDEVLWDTE